jgi:E3 ubiquitin-protein ligase CCNP1IP1
VCPACNAVLSNPDDAVLANLNPTEDYKTSVLSGLSPTVIMECAGRALSFWAYQATQEVYVPLAPPSSATELITMQSVYQEMVVKSLDDRYATLNQQMDKIIREANAEISGLRAKMQSICEEYHGP